MKGDGGAGRMLQRLVAVWCCRAQCPASSGRLAQWPVVTVRPRPRTWRHQWCSDRTRPLLRPRHVTMPRAPRPAWPRSRRLLATWPACLHRLLARVARVGRPAAQCGVLAAAADGHAPCPAHQEHDSFKYGTSQCHRCYSFSHLFRYSIILHADKIPRLVLTLSRKIV